MNDFAALRQRLVDNQIRPSEVTDHEVIKAFLTVPRELFVDPSERPFAYSDRELLMSPAAPSRRMIDPVQLARLLQKLGLRPEDRVMTVGCGSGYSAAIMACLARSVVAVEEDAALCEAARATLLGIGAGNVQVVQANLTEGHAASAPYDKVLLEGSVELVPEAIVDQLAPEGMLAAIVRQDRISRAMLFERIGPDAARWPLFEAWATPLPGFSRPPEFVF